MGRSLPEASFAAMRFARDGWCLAAEGQAMRLHHVPALFSIGNGFIGMRGPGDGADAPKVYLNGVYERMPIAYHEAAHGYARETDLRLAVADATRPAILVEGQPAEAVSSVTLDLTRCVRAETVLTGDIEVTIEQFVAMAQTALVLTRVRFPAGRDVMVKIGRAHV